MQTQPDPLAGVTTAPPPLRDEAVPDPRSGYVWVGGYWDWINGRHFWVSGRWFPERRGYHWQPSHWILRDSRWHFLAGGWATDSSAEAG